MLTTQPLVLVAAFLAVLALGFAGGWGAQGWRGQARVAVLAAEHAQQLAAQASDARVRESLARAEEQRRAAAQQEIADAATLLAQRRERDRRAADVAGGGLRIRAVEFAAGAGAGASDPGATAQCQATEDAARVLAELLGRVEAAGRRMAAIADERGDAGVACERSYDSLRQ